VLDETLDKAFIGEVTKGIHSTRRPRGEAAAR